MEPIKISPAGQRITRIAKRIEASTASDQQWRPVAELIDNPLEEILPPGCLVQLVKNDEGGILGPGNFTDDFSISRDVPIQVGAASIKQGFCQGGLAALAGAGEQYQLPGQIALQMGNQISHMAIINQMLVWSGPKQSTVYISLGTAHRPPTNEGGNVNASIK